VTERDLFIAALQIEDPAGRAAYLDQACGADVELRRRAEALLTAFARAGSFLQQPAADTPATSDVPSAWPLPDAPPAAGPGTILGPYQLLEQLGEGGMGTVFLAEQTRPVQREVALKVIKPGMDSRQVIARFEAERQALALMDHPNIAKVLDAGATDSGRPYFVMELVRGVPITRYCDERRLTPRQRLELFLPVCQAVQHAHQKGVIHRDLKPSNVLVALYDGKPVPKVIDFGVAKAAGARLTEQTLSTGLGQVVGTLEHMSPEQAELNQLDIDTRSDIYSLGVMLYELLTGTTPLERKRFQDTSVLEVLRIIREEEAPTPSARLSTAEALPRIAADRGVEPRKLSGLVRGELDWIVMKCLEKDRNRRYETANALSLDIQRYLDDEPILARRPTLGQRVGKWARRHRTAVRAAGLLLLLAVVGLVVSLGLIWRAKGEAEVARGEEANQKRLAQANAALAGHKMQLAQANRDLAVEALDRILVRLVEKSMFSLDPARNQYADLLDQALGLYERLAEKNSDDPAGWQQAARAYKRVGFLHRALEQNDKAEQALARAVKFGEKAVALSAEPVEGRLLLAGCHAERGELFRDTGRPRQAEKAFRQALTIYRQVVDDRPTARNSRSDLACALMNLAFQLDRNGKAQQAEPYLAESHALLKQLVGEFRKDPLIRENLAGLLLHLAKGHERREQLKEARQLSRQAVQHLEFSRTLQKSKARRDANLCLAYLTLARILARMGQHDQAITYCEKQFRLASELIRDYPRVARIRRALEDAQGQAAVLASAIGGHGELALQLLDQALDLQKQLSDEHKDRPQYRAALGQSYANQGQLLEAGGKYPEAEQALRRALDLLKDLPEERRALANVRLYLGKLFRKVGRLPEAEAEYRRARDNFQKLAQRFPKEPEYLNRVANASYSLANVLEETGRLPEAEGEYRQAVATFRALADLHRDVPDYRLYLTRSELALADTLAAQGRSEQTDSLNRQALERIRKLAADFPSRAEYQAEHASALSRRGVILRKRRQFAEGEQIYRDAVTRWQDLCNKEPDIPDHRNRLATTHYNLGLLLADAGRPQEVEKAYRQALAVQRKLLEELPKVPEYQHLYAQILNNLALRLRDRGEYYQARDLLYEASRHNREAVKLAPAHRRFRSGLCNTLANLVWALLRVGQHAQAAAASEEMTQILPEDWRLYNDAALHLSVCVSVVDKVRQLSSEERAKVTRRYTDQMEKMWREAVRRCPDVPAEQAKLARTLSILADWHARRGDQDTARRLREEAAARRARAGLPAKKDNPP
jgi:eukaryotic-like serine/threonine-protein kinase